MDSSCLEIFLGTQFLGSSRAYGSMFFSKLTFSLIFLSVADVETLDLFPLYLHLPRASSICSLAGEMEQRYDSIQSWSSLCLSTKLCALLHFLISVSTSFKKASFLETAKNERPIEAYDIGRSKGLKIDFPRVFRTNIITANSKRMTIIAADNVTLGQVLFWSVLL